MPNGQLKTLRSRFSPLLQDTFLSCLGSFFAFLMVRWLAEHKAENPADMKGFDRLHFRYREDLSSDEEYVFERRPS